MLHEDAPVQTAVYRIQPGSGLPTHLHARVYDLFIAAVLAAELTELHDRSEWDSNSLVLQGSV